MNHRQRREMGALRGAGTMTLWFVAWTVWLATSGFAQQTNVEADSPERPRIGLVLSGGGARGMAHIGVLQVLEENNIPVDCIAGTSFGALVGGLYASGMPADEIDTLVRSLDWDELLAVGLRREAKPWRRKMEDADFLVPGGIHFDREGSALIRPGIISTRKVLDLFEELLQPVADIRNFDELPIPFRAVTADLETGGEVIISSGSIPTALLASMSVPGVFPPVQRDGHLLVDGGIANNIPLSVVRAMGADIILVVDIGTPMMSAEEISSYLNVIDQVVRIMVAGNGQRTLQDLREGEFLIRPELKDISAGDFERAEPAITAGREAAEVFLSSFGSAAKPNLSLSPSEYRSYRQALAARRDRVEPTIVDRVVIRNNSVMATPIIASRIGQEAGEPFDRKQLQEDAEEILATGYFRDVRFRLEDAGAENHADLLVDVDGSPAHSRLRLGIRFEDDFNGQSDYSVGAEYMLEQLNSLGGEWRTLVTIGNENLLLTEFYQPVSPKQNTFVGVDLRASEESVGLYVEDVLFQQFRIREFSGSIGAGYIFGNQAQVAVRYQMGRVEVDDEIGLIPVEVKSDIGKLELRFLYDTLDDRRLARTGIWFDLTGQLSRDWLKSDLSYEVLTMDPIKPFTIDRHTLALKLSAGFSLDEDAPQSDLLSLGGFLNLSGYSYNQLYGQHRVFGSLIYFYQLLEPGKAKYLTDGVFLGGSLELGNVFPESADIRFENAIFAGSVFISTNTVIGPAFFGYGRAETGVDSFYLFLGMPY